MKFRIFILLLVWLAIVCPQASGQNNQIAKLKPSETENEATEKGNPLVEKNQNQADGKTTVEKNRIVQINNDISFNTSNDDQRNNRTGNGYLGATFIQYGYGWCDFSGDIAFSVYSSSDQVFAVSPSNKALFGKSLLLPQIGAEGMNSFQFTLSLTNINWRKIGYWLRRKPFVPKEKPRPIFWQRFGLHSTHQSNSLIWAKGSDSLGVVVNGLGVYANIPIFIKNIGANDPNNVVVSAFFGYTNRRLGGNYGLKTNRNIQKSMLGTTNLGFDGFEYGFRLDLDKFYGRMGLTYFGKKTEIPGFTGHQLALTLGIKAGFEIKK